ncbi:hypothetical protein BDR03DRAFT_952431 [Suillus americanus]|nr:hypothetical protein BDR03DRAFT_952431 [Suillus americanus]
MSPMVDVQRSLDFMPVEGAIIEKAKTSYGSDKSTSSRRTTVANRSVANRESVLHIPARAVVQSTRTREKSDVSGGLR